MDKGAECYKKFLSGDKNGLSELVLMYRDGLTVYINSIVRNIDTAEELMEDTFVKLYVNKPKFSGKCSFKTWLFSIGRYTTVDYIRRHSKIREISENELGELSVQNSFEREYIKKEEKVQLHDAIKNLKEDYRQILYLIYFEDFTNSDAAAIMDRSPKQIRDLLYNAKKALKTELERRGFEYEGL